MILLSLLLTSNIAVNAQEVTLTHADSLRIDSIEKSYDMEEVVVKSQRKLVSNQVDRISYDVKADEESKTSTILQMLRKVPMVSVDADGTIKVNGSSNFVIFKNGKPNKTFQSNPKDVLGAIPASSIKKIEVITEPGAKYDAEGIGAILNIVTDKTINTNGIMGNASVNYNTLSDRPSGSLWLTTQYKGFAASLTYGYVRWSGKERETEIEAFTQYKNGNMSKSLTKLKQPMNVHYFNFESSLDLGTHDLLTAEFNGYTYNLSADGSVNQWNWDKNGTKTGAIFNAFSVPTFSYWDVNGALNYQHTTELQDESLNLAYRISTTDHHRIDHFTAYDSLALMQMYDAYDKDEQLNFIEHTFEAGWMRPLGKGHSMDIGAKAIFRINDSDSKMEYLNPITPDLNSKTVFRHNTNIAALYADYRYNIQRWGFRAGLRYEYSHLKSHDDLYPERDFSVDLSDWVPSLGASYMFSDVSSLKLNYSRRIQRPGISYLNPYVVTALSFKEYGNPNLKSAANNSLTLSYMLTTMKLTFMPNINLSWVDGEIGEEQFVEHNDYGYDILVSTYANNLKSLTVSPSFYMQWQATNTTKVMANVSATYNKYSHKTLDITNPRWGFMAWGQISQKLPWKLTTELSGHCFNGGAIGLYTISAKTVGMVGLALRRDFLKEDRLSVSLSGSWKPKRLYKTETVHGDTRGYSSVSFPNNATAEISLSYRFGSLKTSVKKTNKRIENDDLTGGIGKAGGN